MASSDPRECKTDGWNLDDSSGPGNRGTRFAHRAMRIFITPRSYTVQPVPKRIGLYRGDAQVSGSSGADSLANAYEAQGVSEAAGARILC
jgi:hypothetical protein